MRQHQKGRNMVINMEPFPNLSFVKKWKGQFKNIKEGGVLHGRGWRLCDKAQKVCSISLIRRIGCFYWRTLPFTHKLKLRDICRWTNTELRFPFKISTAERKIRCFTFCNWMKCGGTFVWTIQLFYMTQLIFILLKITIHYRRKECYSKRP